ncbi:MAG: HD domain-containing protein [Fibrobacteres bacterium]|nr:HD domain-containing protein [Fibrobacterota bacterium]
MKEIRLSDIKVGTVAAHDYFGRDGKILIKKGAVMDSALLSVINRRNISSFYIQEEGEDLKRLLSLKELDTFDLDLGDDLQSSESESDFFSASIDKPPPETVLPVLIGVKKGEEGYNQILNSQPVLSLDEAIAKSQISLSVLPSGTPAKELAKEISVGQRTATYKKEVLTDFDRSHDEVKSLLNSLRAGRPVQGTRITNLVKGFVKTFLNDKHMLLNLATSKSEEKDYVYRHSLNVSLISISIAASRGFDESQIVEVGVSGLLHDVGTLFIPEQIRFKTEPLTKDEILEVQKHPMLGIHLVEKIKGLPGTVPLVCYQSHERENREGYPKQRTGRLIHDYAKIVMVADLYDSQTGGRPYRPAKVPYKAMESLLTTVKQGLLSADIVRFYLEYTSLFPVGSLVMLSTGEIAKVVKPNGALYARPVVSVVVGSDRKLLSDSQVRTYDLKTNNDVKIVQAIDNSKLNIAVMQGF